MESLILYLIGYQKSFLLLMSVSTYLDYQLQTNPLNYIIKQALIKKLVIFACYCLLFQIFARTVQKYCTLQF